MPRKISFSHKVFYAGVEQLGNWCATAYNRIRKIETKHADAVRKTTAYAQACKIIAANNIKTILCTHQRSIDAIPIMLAATDAGIKTIVVIFSWDNLPKATLFCRGNNYFVWSTYMKGEMLKYYPEIKESEITITGTPQFDFYNKPNWIETKETFYNRYNIPFNKKIICFSGDDKLTSPYDELFLEDACIAIMQMSEANRPIILLRGVPVESTKRYELFVEKYPDVVIISKALWKHGGSEGVGWQLYYPTIDDLKLLVNICYHSIGVINLGSTMGIDFSMFEKPTLYVKYNHNKKYGIWDNLTVYNLQHFRTLNGLDAVGWVNSAEEMLPMITKLLNEPNKVGKDKLIWRKKITEDILNAGSTIGQLLNS
jgi:hypothetical protein